MRVITGVMVTILKLTASGEAPPRTPNPDCTPTAISSDALTNPDRRIEDIIEVLTGERQTGDHAPVEETVDDPNFGGVWGDFQGGVVVAVLDCSKVDAAELARIAGGSDYLHLIEVPHTFQEVNEYRTALVEELSALGVAGDVFVNSTLTGHLIDVTVLDLDELPKTFGSGIPDDAFSIVVTTGLTRPAG